MRPTPAADDHPAVTLFAAGIDAASASCVLSLPTVGESSLVSPILYYVVVHASGICVEFICDFGQNYGDMDLE